MGTAGPLVSAGTFAPLRHPIFRAVLVASFFSRTGILIQAVGAAWMMTTLSASSGMVTLVQSASVLPMMAFSMLAGAVADSYDRRRVMLLSQAFMFLVSVMLALLAHTGAMSPWLLLGMTFALGSGLAMHTPAWQIAVHDMVPRNDLPAAVALNGLANNFARTVGPALGGVIVAAAGSAAAFAFNALSNFGLIVVLARWTPPPRPSELPREALGGAIAAGVRYVAMSPNLQKLMLRASVFGFAAIGVQALLPLVARDVLGGGAALFGGLLAGFGVGAVTGSVLFAWTRLRLSTEWVARLTLLATGASATVLAVSPFPALSFAALVLYGSAWVLALATYNVSVQLSSPRWVVGRSLSLFHVFLFGGMALGGWIWGLSTDAYGVQTTLGAIGAVLFAGALMGIGPLKLPPAEPLNLEPLNRGTLPKLDTAPGSGPIRVTVEYIVALDDATEFVAGMADRRRVRRRDGARRWSLARDLERPDRWIESYVVPNWTEYVRHRHRLTHADAAVLDRVRALHCGEQPPLVRYLTERPAPPMSPALTTRR